MDKIAILIPCYNEAQTIGKVVADFRAALPEATVYVYDNNSADDTAAIARSAGAVVRHESRQGKGNVIRAMFREINAECYLMVDGDDTYPAEDAHAMCDAVLQNGMDMVIGDRLSSTYFTENKRPFHNSGNVLVRQLVNRFFRGNITDIMTGYRAFSYIFVKSFPVLSKGFEIETEMTIHALDKNFRLCSLPVGYRDRPQGSESKLNTFSDGFKVLMTILRLYKDYKPLPFFGLITADAGFFVVAGDHNRKGNILHGDLHKLIPRSVRAVCPDFVCFTPRCGNRQCSFPALRPGRFWAPSPSAHAWPP